MSVRYAIAVGLLFLWVVPAYAVNPFGETGFFLTPEADTLQKGEIYFGYRFMDWPRAGGDLHGGSLVFGVAKNLEVGYGVISYNRWDRHTFSVKWRLFRNPVTGFQAVLGGQLYTRGGPGFEKDWNIQGYLVTRFPWPYGNFRLGGIVTKDEQDETKPGFIAGLDYMLYPDIVLVYEYTSLTRINGAPAHAALLRWIPSTDLPIVIDVGAVWAEFEPGAGTDLLVTAGASFIYHEKYLEEKLEPIEDLPGG